ncbi:MAG: putative maltokinase [Verrucomicrobia bacterium]|nr:putative maltokinase [Verrucomicrobiota bacterium]
MAIHMEDRFSIMDILDQTPLPPETGQWIMFLRNHDELTLEMVSDEERDYMYHIYARDPKARINLGIRRRLSPLLDNDRNKIELLFTLLFSLPGTPAIYYGDEIGMGDNYYLGDRNGVRTPMQWSGDKNAGFSNANPQKLYLPLIIDPVYHYTLVNVENQEQSPSSLLWWIRNMLTVRKNHKAFGSGTLEFVTVDNSKILAFTLKVGDEIILVAANLSRFSQAALLDLSKYAAHTPQELFHNSSFPPIEEDPYTMTFGPYGYFWLSLHRSTASTTHDLEVETPQLIVQQKWQNVFTGRAKKVLEKSILPRFLVKSRWFEHKALTVQLVKITATIPMANSMLCIVEVFLYGIEWPDRYLIPISFVSEAKATQTNPIASVKVDAQEGLLYDAIYDESFRKALILRLAHNRKVHTNGYTIVSHINSRFKKEILACAASSRILSVEQSNSALLYGEKFFFKLFRRIEEGIHPEVQMCCYLTDEAHFSYCPAFVGSLAYKKLQGEISTIGLLETYTPNEGTAWSFTLDNLSQFYERVLSHQNIDKADLKELIGSRFFNGVKLIAERTAQLHIALASGEHRDFKPEAFTMLYQRSLYQEMRKMAKEAFALIKKKMPLMNDTLLELSARVLDKHEQLLDYFKRIIINPIDAMKCRIHGDYHLGQLLYTGKDFVVIDFEGEPMRSLSHRLHKRSPLRDVAGMLRSFHYALYRALLTHSTMTPDMVAKVEPWAIKWYEETKALFIQSYLETVQTAPFRLLPSSQKDLDYLLNVLTLEKALYETVYELNVRPEWAMTAFKGLLFLLKE